jgi:hypothetical protein
MRYKKIMSDNRIIKDNCETCNKLELGVEFFHNGTPVLFTCRFCDEQAFERQARVDIDRWLAGGSLRSAA